MAWRVVALDALPDEPWRNGGGRTRTIAVQTGAAGDEPPWDWRISVATLEQSGAFSAFPGVDRASLLLGSGSLELSADSEPTVRLHQPGDVAVYRGDACWQAEIRRFGPPLSLLNVMTRRGAACGRVRAVRDDAVVSGHALAVVVVDGLWRVSDAPDGQAVWLSTGQCAVREGAPGPSIACSRLERESSVGWLAAVSIERV